MRKYITTSIINTKETSFNMNVFDSIITGLNEAVDYEKGKISAKKTTLRIEPLPDISAEDIKAIRKKLGFTQAVFAAVIGVSTKTVEAWETGTNQPIGPARRIISLIQFDPEILQSYHIVNENVI